MPSHRLLAAALLPPLALLSAPAHSQATTSIPDRTCSILDEGAEGSRIWAQLTHYDTRAFQAAIDRCAAAGGGTVEVPKGEWMIGPIYLKSNIRLNIAKGAEVLGGTDPALFGEPNADGERIGLINIADAENVEVAGEGLIDGQGAVWWERMRALWRSDPRFATDGQARQKFPDRRPRLVRVSNSRNVALRGVTFANSPSFHLVIADSEYVTVERARITAPTHGPNTDAIDPTRSRRILITDNFISVGDDAVAIKSGNPDPRHPDAISADITVRGNMIHASRGICIGSQTNGGVTRVLVENNEFVGSMYGFRIKTARERGGEISDITFRNNRMTDVDVPLVFSGYYAYRPMDRREAERQVEPTGFILGNQIWPGEDDPARAFVHDKTPRITGVTVDGLAATGAEWAGIATGLPESPIDRLVLRNVKVEADKGFLLRHATVEGTPGMFAVTAGPPMIVQRNGRLQQP
ncbi:glycoside hydrolase family 28 protein [Sphingopyxis sp.]|uniref:glycoside hydrolase family 28 protein n=1 Tax=Sphingopyxis sp. TaxID=1908224 RepID=UPI00262D4E4D|nr:glycoside hydrolase family 28 protein [Sphingopyxis sp.]MCW0196606.1 glycoside hydrolase family 28 protein [Sphingopyxis sp.]